MRRDFLGRKVASNNRDGRRVRAKGRKAGEYCRQSESRWPGSVRVAAVKGAIGGRS